MDNCIPSPEDLYSIFLSLSDTKKQDFMFCLRFLSESEDTLLPASDCLPKEI